MSRNLIARLAVAAFAIPVILWVCYQGGLWLLAMVMAFALVGLGEFLAGESIRPTRMSYWLSMGAMILMVLSATGWPGSESLAALTALEFGNHSGPFLILLAYFMISAMVLAIGKRPPAELFRQHARLTWGLMYIGLLYPFVYLVGEECARFNGGDLLLFLFGVLWVGDTAAMGIGAWLGERKLAPTVSPNKTIAGFVGGIVGALLIGILMYFWKFPNVSLGHILAIAIGCSVFGQIGDLVESMWKRSLGIKDSSALIPGHGGILDRFDSLLFAAPFMYLYVRHLC